MPAPDPFRRLSAWMRRAARILRSQPPPGLELAPVACPACGETMGPAYTLLRAAQGTEGVAQVCGHCGQPHVTTAEGGVRPMTVAERFCFELVYGEAVAAELRRLRRKGRREEGPRT